MGGGDKGLLMLGGQTVLAHVIERLTPQVTAVALNANGDPARFADLSLPVLPDTEPEFPGPLAGVLAGLDWAALTGAADIVTVAADTPFFPADLVAKLKEARDAAGTPIALAATPDPNGAINRHPTFGLWPVNLRGDLRVALRAGTRKIVDWTDAMGCATATFPTKPFDPFFNINQPEDLMQAEDMLRKLL